VVTLPVRPALEALVRSVAKGSLAAALATTEVNRVVLVCFVFDRYKGRTLVGSIAERLLLALATRAPPVNCAG